MTKAQRIKHIAAINDLLEQKGFEANRFGIYHKDSYKIDTRDTNLKVWKGDFKKLSKPLVQITLDDMTKILSKLEDIKNDTN
jgi:hypothetical protein